MSNTDPLAAVGLLGGIALILWATVFTPVNGLMFYAHEVDDSSLPDNATVTEYEDLNLQMQEVFDEARRDGAVPVNNSKPDWYGYPGFVE